MRLCDRRPNCWHLNERNGYLHLRSLCARPKLHMLIRNLIPITAAIWRGRTNPVPGRAFKFTSSPHRREECSYLTMGIVVTRAIFNPASGLIARCVSSERSARDSAWVLPACRMTNWQSRSKLADSKLVPLSADCSASISLLSALDGEDHIMPISRFKTKFWPRLTHDSSKQEEHFLR